MARSNSQPYWTDVDNSGNNNNQFERLGSPGKYYGALVVATGTSASFTGSNYGYGAVMLSAGADVANSHLDVLEGGRIVGTDLTAGVVYDIAPEEIVAHTGPIYVFKVQDY